MMRALVLLFVVAASSSQAEVVTFRSGDHPDFSRLVADIPAGSAWSVGRAADGYVLQLDTNQTYDINGVFDRIQRNRLASVRPVGGTGRLMLDIACLCHVDAFLFSPDKLVIDIKDGPAPSGSPFEARLDGTDSGASTIIPLLAQDSTTAALSGLSLLPDPLALAADTQPRVTATERSIIESLARAASQGLLDFDLPAETAPAVAVSEVGVPDTMPLPAFPATSGPATSGPTTRELQPSPIPFATVAETPRPGLRVETSVDRDRPTEMPLALTTEGDACLDDSHFDIASWSGSTDFATEIGMRRAALTSDRDQFPEGAIEALARTYLYFGFGREAEQALSLDNIRSPDREILHTLAQIIDGESIQAAFLSGQKGCTRPVALWTALAHKTLDGTTEAERIAILAAFHVLPDTLRPLIGEKLARLFLDSGDPASAESIMAIAANAEMRTPQAGMMTAAIELETDGPQAAISTLEALATDPDELSPEAVIALINLSLSQDLPLGDDILSLADAMQFENRQTPLGQQLADAEFRALMAADRFDDAMVLLDGTLKGLSAEERQAYRTELMIAMAERMPNAAFLEAAFGGMATDLAPAAENALARRLLALGFTEQAAAFVSGPASGDDMAERRYLRAEAAFAMGLATAGEEALSGMTDARAMALRGTAQVPGSPITATATNPEVSWRTGTWGLLERGDDPLLQAASAAMLTDSVVPGPDSTLAERAALVADAQATRTLATDLLSRFTIAPENPNPAIN